MARKSKKKNEAPTSNRVTSILGIKNPGANTSSTPKKPKTQSNKITPIRRSGTIKAGGRDVNLGSYINQVNTSISRAINDSKGPGNFDMAQRRLVADTISRYAADGNLSSRDLSSIRGFIRKNPDIPTLEEEIIVGAVENQVSQDGYNQFVSGQTGDYANFVSSQRNVINGLLSKQNKSLAKQTKKIQKSSKKSLKNFQSSLAAQQDASRSMLEAERAKFDAGNAASEAAIRQYQSAIAGIPGFTETDQVGDDFDRVQSQDDFGNVSQQRAPIAVQRKAAITGFSKEQVASQKRQQKGIAGFRR